MVSVSGNLSISRAKLLPQYLHDRHMVSCTAANPSSPDLAASATITLRVHCEWNFFYGFFSFFFNNFSIWFFYFVFLYRLFFLSDFCLIFLAPLGFTVRSDQFFRFFFFRFLYWQFCISVFLSIIFSIGFFFIDHFVIGFFSPVFLSTIFSSVFLSTIFFYRIFFYSFFSSKFLYINLNFFFLKSSESYPKKFSSKSDEKKNLATFFTLFTFQIDHISKTKYRKIVFCLFFILLNT